MNRQIRSAVVTILLFSQGLCFIAAAQTQQDYPDDSGPLQVGYAVITPTSGTPSEMIVFESFGLKTGTQTLQAGIVPGDATTNSMVFVNMSVLLSRDLGIALLNLQTVQAEVTMTIRRTDGIQVGIKTIFVGPRQQIAMLATELFADVPTVPKELTGTLSISSNIPVVMAALRIRGPSFSTLPVKNFAASASVPVIAPGVGGPGSIVLPHFVAGAGWASEIVIINNSSSILGVRLDLFKQKDGSALNTRLNQQSGTTFRNELILPGAVFT